MFVKIKKRKSRKVKDKIDTRLIYRTVMRQLKVMEYAGLIRRN